MHIQQNHAQILKHAILHFRLFSISIKISLHGVSYSFPYVVHAAFVCMLHPPYVESDSQLSEFREFTLVFYMIQDVTQWVLYLCVFDSFAHLQKKKRRWTSSPPVFRKITTFQRTKAIILTLTQFIPVIDFRILIPKVC